VDRVTKSMTLLQDDHPFPFFPCDRGRYPFQPKAF
jgi:hypothetical protein